MKLIIQIPCFNEAAQLPQTLAEIPRSVTGFDEVERRASGTRVPDTTSGFRAYNREAALQVQVVSKFTYTLETIIQAGKMLVAVEHVPIKTNPDTRPSRLFPSMWAYVRRNATSIF